MKKLVNKKTLKLVSATAMCIFSLFVCFSGAMAWFQSTRQLANEGDQFKVSEIESSVQSITAHEFLGKDSKDHNPQYTEIASGSGTGSVNYTIASDTDYVHIVTSATLENLLTFSGNGNTISLGSDSLKDANGQKISARNRDFVIDLVASTLKAEGTATTLTVGYTQNENAFAISIAKNVPSDSDAFLFNPVGITIFDGEDFSNEDAVALGEYSLEDSDHPLLLMFAVSDGSERISLTTDFAFLGDKANFLAAKFASNAEVSEEGLSNGDYVQIVKDSTHSNKPALYKYNGSTLVDSGVTYATLSALNSAAATIKGDNANILSYYCVIADEEHGFTTTIYQLTANKEFEMVWLDLGNHANGHVVSEKTIYESNPLSSAVIFHSFEFSGTIGSNTSSHNIYSLNNNLEYQATSTNCIAIDSSRFTASNKSSFTNFTNAETYSYSREITVYQGEIINITYIGVVINYDSQALQYIFSNNLGHESFNSDLYFLCDWLTTF